MKFRDLIILVILAILFPVVLLAGEREWLLRAPARGMVAADSAQASQVGAEVLRAGGNAFDAAIATSFALAVTRPYGTGLGGGGFMVAYDAQAESFVVLDFRETAPPGYTAEYIKRVIDKAGDGPPPTLYGGNASGVPGQLAGLAWIRKHHGTMAWPELVRGALALCEEGIEVDEDYQHACRTALDVYRRYPALREQCPALYRDLLGHGTPPEAGARLTRPKLARALRLIGETGPAAFYGGPLGEAVAKAVVGAGGKVDEAAILAYRPKVRQPIRVAYLDYEVVSMPPPSSGGICLAEILNILETCRLRSDLPPMTDPHVLVEAMKHAFADRARWLGDADFADVPVDRLTSQTYAASLAQRIRPERALSRDAYGQQLPDDQGTSHFCVADRHGNVVALTETINGTFGSFVVAEPYGIILNNQMDDFAADPGQPNQYGLVQGQANAVAPGKRPLSSMSPTIVMHEGRPVLALGASGGPRIITSVLQVMLNVIDHGMGLEEAVERPRIHHQWLPDVVRFDRTPPAAWLEALREAGHTIDDERTTGIVQAIQLRPDETLVGASDPRKGGRPAAP